MRIKALYRLAKMKFSRKIPKGISKGLKYTAIGTGAGGIAAASTSASFSRKDDAQKGLVIGGLVGLSMFATPRILRNPVVKRALNSTAKQLKREASVRGKVVFRRIRGRIIPIRKKQ